MTKQELIEFYNKFNLSELHIIQNVLTADKEHKNELELECLHEVFDDKLEREFNPSEENISFEDTFENFKAKCKKLEENELNFLSNIVEEAAAYKSIMGNQDEEDLDSDDLPYGYVYNEDGGIESIKIIDVIFELDIFLPDVKENRKVKKLTP